MSEPTTTPPPSASPGHKALTDARRLWTRIPVALRFLVVAMVVAGAVFAAAGSLLDSTSYGVLYAGLAEQDAAAVVARLKEQHTPYRLEGEGSTIMVPADLVHEVRLDMAANNLPAGGGVGLELFDQQKFGMTEFEERVAMKRALEGELSRTISKIRSIKNARVHLVMPKRSLFKSDPVDASASIVIEPFSSARLPEEVIPAIVHLVSSSVEGLDPDRVTVVDTRGRLLSMTDGTRGTGRTAEVQRGFERDMEQKVAGMLDQTVGPNASVVKVSSEFDFTTEETTEERFDPERSVLRSEHREVETAGGSSSTAGGIPGTRSNLPGGPQPMEGGGGSSTRRELETRNYEVDKLVRRTVSPSARLKRISVAVLLDGTGEPGQAFVPRPAEEMKKIETAVRGVIGFDADRGDRVEVMSIPFHPATQLEEPEEVPASDGMWWWVPIAGGAAVVIALLAMILLRKRRPARSAVLDVDTLPLPSTVRELEAMVTRPLMAGNTVAERGRLGDGTEVVNQVREIFTNERESASRVLKAWISEAHGHKARQVKG